MSPLTPASITCVLLGIACSAARPANVPATLPAAAVLPPHRSHHALTYDPVAKRVLLSGGSQWINREAVSVLSDLWSFDGKQWRSLGPDSGIKMLERQLFADGRGNILSLRGSGRTARWDGRQWVTLTEDSLLRRYNAAGAWDTPRQRYVLFGGKMEIPDRMLNDTWEFDGARWTRVAVDGPPPNWMAGMAYDSKRGVIVLTGGRPNPRQGVTHRETWEWNGRSWTRVADDGPGTDASGAR